MKTAHNSTPPMADRHIHTINLFDFMYNLLYIRIHVTGDISITQQISFKEKQKKKSVQKYLCLPQANNLLNFN